MACLHLVVLEMEKKGRKGRCASMTGLTLSTKLSESQKILLFQRWGKNITTTQMMGVEQRHSHKSRCSPCNFHTNAVSN